MMVNVHDALKPCDLQDGSARGLHGKCSSLRHHQGLIRASWRHHGSFIIYTLGLSNLDAARLTEDPIIQLALGQSMHHGARFERYLTVKLP
jgi:hypothetical protein